MSYDVGPLGNPVVRTFAAPTEPVMPPPSAIEPMMPRPRRIAGFQLIEALAAAGIIEDGHNVKRVVIDIVPLAAVVIHIERIGDTRLLDIAPVLTGVRVETHDGEAR